MCVLSHFSYVRLFATLQTVALQAPLSIGFPWQEYWSAWPFPSPGDLSDPGIKPLSSALVCRVLTADPTGGPITLTRFLIFTKH